MKSVRPQPDTSASIADVAVRIEHHLAAIRRAMRQPLDAEIAKGNVTMPQKAVMQVVVQAPGVILKELSEAVSLAHSTVSGIVDRLAKRGMIQRRPDKVDGRITRIYPTPVVVHFVRDRIPALLSEPLHAALARASAADRSRIVSALQRLHQLLESE